MKDIYNKAMAIYDDYRYYVPSFSSAALSFYLIILLMLITMKSTQVELIRQIVEVLMA